MTIVTLGIDLGKNLNSIVGLDAEERVVLRRRVRRATLAELAGKLEPCTVALEACCGAHHVGRLFAAKGHEVRLMSPEHVRPYVRAQKNDDNDAAGIAEAATRPTMRFVELKSQERLDLQTLHRARSRLVAARKALVNQLRAILLERGHTFRQGRRVLEREIEPFLAEPPSDLSVRILVLIADMRAEWRSLDERIDALNDDLTEHARADEAAGRLTSIPGIGILGATALFAAVGNGEAFRRARDIPAWLGLVPKQMTTGGKPRLLSITKRGNRHLRMLLIHGARAALPSLSKQATPLGSWLRGLLSRAHRNVVIVALAAKLARIAWATLRHGVRFEPEKGTVMTA
ncbi:IS110 family RNA-guided transposase [Aliihoeflea sp. 2WW]|uniref:IS110 family transposase n=1 Tax=Aliihoeflea sp. 2WW TaxID=1381123 RepID=UPI000463F5EB|nr:IS110 family transposase [Aliihoeflea sp. 2WW]